eukprot:TRINITY_DN9011_c0_g1_i1.p1 TRINITY_DN9011_c0_g1~~TRINITY_DN9011_c0_g1_i1.p1  ORF type:complete len:259 (+),score=46.55 TRINITY_DN9011_c0_g1_i1:67-777(+)
MLQSWISCWVAFAAIQGVRFEEESASSRHQVEEELILPPLSCGVAGGSCFAGAVDLITSWRERREIKIELGGNYENVSLVGKGAYGKVYRAQDTKTQEHVVIKKLIVDETNLTEDMIEYARKLHRLELQRECELLMSLDSKLVVKCLKNFDDKESPIIVLEDAGVDAWAYIAGIRDKVQRLKESIWIIKEALKAVECLASKRVMHRDLKPDNIAVKGNDVKLIDFGTAIRVEKKAT